MIETSVFKRTEISGEILSSAMYNFAIGVVLCWGFLFNWLIVESVPDDFISGYVSLPIFLIGYFASCLFGVYLFNTSDKPLISFIGYNLVVIPFGFVVNQCVAGIDENIVSDAIRVTGTVTVIMMILGSTYPKFFESIYSSLGIALLSVIVIELISTYFFHTHHSLIDWAVALIFCGYIGYDWGRANQIPKTLDNAIDSAAALYMDIINLFLRLIRILNEGD